MRIAATMQLFALLLQNSSCYFDDIHGVGKIE